MAILTLRITGKAKEQFLALQERDLIPVLEVPKKGHYQGHNLYPGRVNKGKKKGDDALHLTLGELNCAEGAYDKMLTHVQKTLNQTHFPEVIGFLEQGEVLKMASIMTLEDESNNAMRSFAETYNIDLDENIAPTPIYKPFKAHVSLAYNYDSAHQTPTTKSDSKIKAKMGNLVLENEGVILELFIRNNNRYDVSHAYREYKSKMDELKGELDNHDYLKPFVARIEDQMENQLVEITEEQLRDINKLIDLRLSSLKNPSIKAALQQVERFREAGKSIISIRNNFKANLIETALLTAQPNENVAENKEVKGALSYHRICGFFGMKTADALKRVQEAAESNQNRVLPKI